MKTSRTRYLAEKFLANELFELGVKIGGKIRGSSEPSEIGSLF